MSANRVVRNVEVRLQRLLDVRVHAQELPRRRVVVAPDQVGDRRRIRVRPGEPERRVAAQTSGGLGIAPGVVVDRSRQRT